MGESSVASFGVIQQASCCDLVHFVGRAGGKGGGSIKKINNT